jgi:hypothetical protein
VSKGLRLRKDTDYETSFKCAGGIGLLREEVWVDKGGVVVRYNLAFLLPHRIGVDNGRILGYDKAHGSTSDISWEKRCELNSNITSLLCASFTAKWKY